MTEPLEKIREISDQLNLSDEDKKAILDFLNNMPPVVARSFLSVLKKNPLYMHRFLRFYYLKRAAILTHDGGLLEKVMQEESEEMQAES